MRPPRRRPRRWAALRLNFERKVGEHGMLYGSVTSMDIADALKEKGYEIDRRRIHLREPIKETGEFTGQRPPAPRGDRRNPRHRHAARAARRRPAPPTPEPAAGDGPAAPGDGADSGGRRRAAEARRRGVDSGQKAVEAPLSRPRD